MVDPYGRSINYLRISVTDRCNLRCAYCTSGDMDHYRHQDILTYEEILRLCEIFAGLGVDTFRITGGEPLVRKDCPAFIKTLANMPWAKNVSVTTNGIHLASLGGVKLSGINMSLDALDPGVYKKITGSDQLPATLAGLKEALLFGVPIKINAVIMAGVNQSEILPLAALAETHPVHVRFIELMPSTENTGLIGVSQEEILKILTVKYPDLAPHHGKSTGPAVYYKSHGLQGKIGFISPVNHSFCEDCNRLRLSATGFLRLCLHHDDGIALLPLLRQGYDDAFIKAQIVQAIATKPKEHLIGSQTNLGDMSKIGG